MTLNAFPILPGEIAPPNLKIQKRVPDEAKQWTKKLCDLGLYSKGFIKHLPGSVTEKFKLPIRIFI
jgi:hypothetical protein